MRDRDLLTEFATSTVLVIDDQAANVDLLLALLRKAGLSHVIGETDPRSAAAGLAAIDPDLILLDLHMPQMDGLDVLDEVVAFAAGAYLPVLLLTADTSREALQSAFSRGADDFVTKPFFTTEVLLRVKNLLRTRALYGTLRREHVSLADQFRQLQATASENAETLAATQQRISDVIAHDQVLVVVQPIVDLRSSSTVGFECLARFPGGASEPAQPWFRDADRVGLGPELERHAAQAALRLLPLLPRDIFLAVNASASAVIGGHVTSVLSPEACPSVVLELTEHVPVEDYAAMSRLLQPLRDDGLRLAVDDTGAGYAGLQHLIGLAPDIIKLDIALIRHVDVDPARRALASALVSFAADVGARLIAEGIETSTELATLRELGVEWGQGFLLARPAPVSSFDRAGTR